jgi:hypothetical protein
MSIQTVDVVVHLPALGRELPPSTLTVQVEDTSAADAPAVVVTRILVHAPSLDLSSEVPLRFQMPYTGEARNLTVSATLSVHGAGATRPGDLITPAAVRVVTGQPSHVRLAEYRGR